MLTKGRCLNHAGDAEGLPQQSSMQDSSLVSNDAEHVLKLMQSVHSEPLCLPGTHQFNTMHIAESGDVFQFEQPATSAEQPAAKLCNLCRHKLECFNTLCDSWWCNTC